MIIPEVIFDKIDHCAKNPIPRTVMMDVKNRNNSFLSTPQMVTIKMIAKSRKIIFVILTVILRLSIVTPNFIDNLFIARLTNSLDNIQQETIIAVNKI